MSAKGIHTTTKWVPGYAGIHGNELADQAAKKIATEAKSTEDPITEPLTITAAGLSTTFEVDGASAGVVGEIDHFLIGMLHKMY